LPYFDLITIGITDVITNLVLVLFWWRQKLGTPGAPFGIHGCDVFDANVKKAADPVWIA
jgi:hypothetical protein